MAGHGIKQLVAGLWGKHKGNRAKFRSKVVSGLRRHFNAAFEDLYEVNVVRRSSNGTDLYEVKVRHSHNYPYIFHVRVDTSGEFRVRLYMGPNAPNLD